MSATIRRSARAYLDRRTTWGPPWWVYAVALGAANLVREAVLWRTDAGAAVGFAAFVVMVGVVLGAGQRCGRRCCGGATSATGRRSGRRAAAADLGARRGAGAGRRGRRRGRAISRRSPRPTSGRPRPRAGRRRRRRSPPGGGPGGGGRCGSHQRSSHGHGPAQATTSARARAPGRSTRTWAGGGAELAPAADPHRAAGGVDHLGRQRRVVDRGGRGGGHRARPRLGDPARAAPPGGRSVTSSAATGTRSTCSAGPAAAPPLGHPHRLGAEQALHPGQRPGGPVARLDGVDRPGAAPEAELAAAGRHDLVGRQPQPGQPGRGAVGAPAVQPPVELPAHPVGDGQRGEACPRCATPARAPRRARSRPRSTRRVQALPRGRQARRAARRPGRGPRRRRPRPARRAGRARRDRASPRAAGAVTGGRSSSPRASRWAASPSAPKRPTTSATGSAARAPSVRRPSRSSTSTSSGPAGPPGSASTATGERGARNAGCRRAARRPALPLGAGPRPTERTAAAGAGRPARRRRGRRRRPPARAPARPAPRTPPRWPARPAPRRRRGSGTGPGWGRRSAPG